MGGSVSTPLHHPRARVASYGRPPTVTGEEKSKPQPAFGSFAAADPEQLGQRRGDAAHALRIVERHFFQAPPVAQIILTAPRPPATRIGATFPVAEMIVDHESHQPVAGAERRAPPLREGHVLRVFRRHWCLSFRSKLRFRHPEVRAERASKDDGSQVKLARSRDAASHPSHAKRLQERHERSTSPKTKGGGAPKGATYLGRIERDAAAAHAGAARLPALHRGTRQGERIHLWLSSRPALPET